MRMNLALLVLCLAVSPALAGPLQNVKVLNDRAPDCSSLESIVRSVTRGCKTDDERVIAIYNFCRYIEYHHAYPNEPGGISALKFIHVYGWGLCGGEHTVLAALWEKAGYPWRYRGWSSPGHTTVEVSYGGRWHYLDTFLKFYAWMPDPQAPGGRTIAGQEDIRANPALLSEGFVMDQERKVCYHKDNRFGYAAGTIHWTAPAFLVCGDDLPGIAQGIASSRNAGSPRGWGAIKFDDPDYSSAVSLGVGYALTLNWSRVEDGYYFAGSKRPPGHSCGDKDYRNCPVSGPPLEPYRELNPARSWSNGTLVFKPDFQSAAFTASLQEVKNVVWRGGTLRAEDESRPAQFVIPMASPYVIVKASGRIASEDAKTEVSPDGKTWQPVDLQDFSKAVVGRYRCGVRVTFRKPISAIELTSLVEHNQEALPYLAPGVNKIAVSAENPAALGDNRLVVTYAYCPGSRDATPAQLFDSGKEIARAHNAAWAKTPLVVQKVIDRLPQAFEIPVPTPKGKQPVYPRMVLLRREVLAPGEKPRDVPAPPSEPAVGPEETLATLPNPWTIGIERPPAEPEKPTRTSILAPVKTAYVSKQGEVFEHQFVKWLKDNSNAWVLLVGFDRKKLPDVQKLASARLVLYVEEAHNEAPMETAAVALQAPFEPGKPFDFAQLGRTVGTTIVAKGAGPGAPFNPPRRYEIDVTGAVRAWCRGEGIAELAVRIAPNRRVDDGWTVRFTPARERPAELAVATHE